ncbi:hypothetical protein GGQ68_003167 [Sagittula marina]|uniref:Lipoprotein n=1 Tax=Sagittula marina TaxID=943940 RepID=A0A7W6GUZ2_9RHOB|nr:hypothetical protein [Sagittula marina]MBB3986824.1 hypothetical protein [Sagittula marina]
MKQMIRAVALCALTGLATGCTMPKTDASMPNLAFSEQQTPEAAKVMALKADLLALGPGVDPDEAQRVAEVAVMEPLEWAQEWNVEDPPLLHNMKVNHGLRPRGLCKDWADDLQVAMWGLNLQTIDLHRAIANSRNIKLEHSVLIVSAKGAAMEQGIVLDPWRQGLGRLWWGPVLEDPRYHWDAREDVFAWKREWQARVAEGG